MQLYALDSEKKIIFARDASRQIDYFCLECEGVLHLRGGFHRQNHFYHLEVTRDCRQNGKTLEHLQTQLYFLKNLPENDCHLEKRFPDIQRIADVFWASKKIVFEIQCSQITIQEIQDRNRDYRQLGLEVIWILHDKRYNKDWVAGSEDFLHLSTHYFTNISHEGEGHVYDQFSVVEKGRRKHRFLPLTVDFQAPKYAGKSQIKLACVKERLQKSLLYFSGDLVDRCLEDPEGEYVSAARELESSREQLIDRSYFVQMKAFWFKFVVRPYRLLLQLLLERACR